jgi:hypothetical protein
MDRSVQPSSAFDDGPQHCVLNGKFVASGVMNGGILQLLLATDGQFAAIGSSSSLFHTLSENIINIDF